MGKKQRKRFWTVAIVFTLLAMPLQTFAEDAQVTAGAAAVVNGALIPQENFDNAIQWVKQRLLRPGKQLSEAQAAEIEKEVLEKLINQALLYQESQNKEFRVEISEVRDQLNKMKREFQDAAEFRNALNKMGVFGKDVEFEIKQRMETRLLVEDLFVKNIIVPDQEIKAYYNSHADLFWQHESVRVSHILVKVDDRAGEIEKSEARGRIESIRESLEAGEDFSSLASAHSECPSAVNGGDLGFLNRGQMLGPFDAAAFSLSPGEVSDIVETGYGYHLIKVSDRRGEAVIFYEDARDRILRHLKNEQVQKQVNQYVEGLKRGAEIERLLTKNS